MEDDPQMTLPFETHRYTGYVQTHDGVRIDFPTPTDLWLNVDGATHFFLNRAARKIKQELNRELDRDNVVIVLTVADDE